MLVPSSRWRLVLALSAFGAALLGCGDATPSAPPEDSRVTIDPTACVIETPPGPNDRVPEPGEMDVSDLGNGRWRLCLKQPAAVDVEGSAWCTWDEPRTFVNEVAGLPIALGPESTVDGGVSILRHEAYLSSSAASMIGSWEGGPVSMEVSPNRDSSNVQGSASFLIPQIVDPEHPPAVRPPDAAGVIAWQCGDAPAPRGA